MDNEHASAIHSWSPTSNVINLSASHQEGLVAVGSFAALSIVTTSLLLLFLIRRALLHTVVHAKQASSFKHDILILNLLLAQLIQSLGFVVGIRWSVAGHISASSGWCDAQAGFLQTGDLASGAFALAIAVQCFWMTVRRRKMSHVCMLLIGLVIWVFAIILTASGRASKVDFFAPGAGDWCEISQKYGAERLWLHYFWLFLDAFGIITICSALIIHRIVNSRFLGTHSSCGDDLHRTHMSEKDRTMLLYSYVYVILTLPLTIVRLITAVNTAPSTTAHLVAAVLSASTGGSIVVLYILTCHTRHTSTSSPTRGINTKDISYPMPFYSSSTPPHLGNTTVITGKGALDFRSSVNSRTFGQNMSANSVRADGFEAALEESLGGVDGVRKKTTISVFTSPAPPVNTPMEGSIHGAKESMDSWHTWV